VSLLLLKGPPTNVIQEGPPIVVGIPNSGSFVWTPASSLEATAGNTGYGLQLIDDVTGQYQYSTQFGISKGPECNSYVTPSSSSMPYGGGYPVATSSAASSKAASAVSSSAASVKPVTSTKANSSVVVITKTSSHMVASTGAPAGNATLVQPTRSMSVPSSLLMSATGSATRSAPAQATTNAAAGLKAGAGLVGAAAALALMF
jgi:hypothetical protein